MHHGKQSEEVVIVKSEIVEYRFTIKEDGRNQPFIACEPCGGDLSILGKNAFLSLHLKLAISIDEAQDIANYLNGHIECVSVTQTPPNWMSYGKAWMWRFQKMLTRLRTRSVEQGSAERGNQK